jgi:hypothetical protein
MKKPELSQCIRETKKGKFYAHIPGTGNKSFKFDKREKAEEIAKYWLDRWETLFPSGGDRK